MCSVGQSAHSEPRSKGDTSGGTVDLDRAGLRSQWITGPYAAPVRHDEIRGAVKRELRREHGSGSGTRYRYEFGIGLGETRVDVVAINGQLSGFEIKGDRDNLNRLAHQVSLYGKVLDAAALVTEERHAEKAAVIVPDWWGLWTCVSVGRWPVIERVRAGGFNPDIDAFSVAQLLWRDEAYAELVARDLATGLRTATRWRLWEVLASELPLLELSGAVRQRLRARRGW